MQFRKLQQNKRDESNSWERRKAEEKEEKITVAGGLRGNKTRLKTETKKKKTVRGERRREQFFLVPNVFF